jgi:hypothetical protein
MSAGSGLQDTILRVNPATGTPLAWVSNPTVSGVSLPHPYMYSEMVRKLYNNATTTSNAFAVSMTVVFYEVRTINGSPVTISDDPAGGLIQRPALGKEAYLNAPGDLRQQFYAIVDRSNLGLVPQGAPGAGTISGQISANRYPFHGAMDPAVNGAPPGQLTPIVPAAPGGNMPALPPGYQNPLGPVNLYLANVVPVGTLPYTKSYAANTTVYADGNPIVIGPGTILLIGVGANQEQVQVNYVNEDGSLNLASVPGKQHAVGELVSNCALGNPGIPGITPGMASFDRFTNPNPATSPYTAVAPYVWKKPKN